MWNWYITGMITAFLFVSIAINLLVLTGSITIVFRRHSVTDQKIYDWSDDSGSLRRVS